ncbi:MAG: hypothetical protein DI570_14520 [Phenylobacterium zucineum]|nr:MAG: hypothetical protein DI570_14520 [Phenylobacterium zucineum]
MQPPFSLAAPFARAYLRRMKTARLAILSLAALAAAAPAFAEDAVGDWIGQVKTPGGVELSLAAHLRKAADGTLEGYAESPDQSPMTLAMAELMATSETLDFSLPLVRAKYAAKWDPATRAWVGTLTQGGAAMPLNLTRGVAPPRPVVPGLDGAWSGTVAAPQGELRLELAVKTDAGGTLATFKSPDQSPLPLVAHLKRAGDDVGFELRGIAEFAGKLSADGATITGEWKQGGATLPVTFRRGGQGA